MDGWVVASIAIAAAYVGYMIGILLMGGGTLRGGGGGGGADPVEPPVGPDDFYIWELELEGLPADGR